MAEYYHVLGHPAELSDWLVAVPLAMLTEEEIREYVGAMFGVQELTPPESMVPEILAIKANPQPGTDHRLVLNVFCFEEQELPSLVERAAALDLSNADNAALHARLVREMEERDQPMSLTDAGRAAQTAAMPIHSLKPWDLAQLIAINSKPTGRQSEQVKEWRQELDDLSGPEEAKRLIASARELVAKVEAKPEETAAEPGTLTN